MDPIHFCSTSIATQSMLRYLLGARVLVLLFKLRDLLGLTSTYHGSIPLVPFCCLLFTEFTATVFFPPPSTMSWIQVLGEKKKKHARQGIGTQVYSSSFCR